MPVDMACASSLAALHQAVAALQRGDVDLALVGGVNTTLSMALARFHRDMGMLSKSGQCNAFDSAADGFIRSEGCGVLVLQHLSEAEADGNRIWGLVKGTAVNQSGVRAALPVPNGPAQERVMEDALAMAGSRSCRRGLPGSSRHRHRAGGFDRTPGPGLGLRPRQGARAAPCSSDQSRPTSGTPNGRRGWPASSRPY